RATPADQPLPPRIRTLPTAASTRYLLQPLLALRTTFPPAKSKKCPARFALRLYRLPFHPAQFAMPRNCGSIPQPGFARRSESRISRHAIRLSPAPFLFPARPLSLHPRLRARRSLSLRCLPQRRSNCRRIRCPALVHALRPFPARQELVEPL